MLLHHYQIGLETSKAIETIMGNEEEFTDPILFDALLERVHIDLFYLNHYPYAFGCDLCACCSTK